MEEFSFLSGFTFVSRFLSFRENKIHKDVRKNINTAKRVRDTIRRHTRTHSLKKAIWVSNIIKFKQCHRVSIDDKKNPLKCIELNFINIFCCSKDFNKSHLRKEEN